MKQWLLKRIKKLFENTESTITTVIVLALLGGSAGILALSKKALTFFLQISNIPTPIWATILLVLLGCLYIYLKLRRSLSYSESPPETQAQNARLEYITIGDHKWQIAIFKNGSFSVDKYPFCKKHDLKFIYRHNYIYCPEVDKGNCKNEIHDNDQFKTYETAKSYIEKEIRNRYGSASLKKESPEAASASSEPAPRRKFFNRFQP